VKVLGWTHDEIKELVQKRVDNGSEQKLKDQIEVHDSYDLLDKIEKDLKRKNRK